MPSGILLPSSSTNVAVKEALSPMSRSSAKSGMEQDAGSPPNSTVMALLKMPPA
jgi:hypothetical protein